MLCLTSIFTDSSYLSNLSLLCCLFPQPPHLLSSPLTPHLFSSLTPYLSPPHPSSPHPSSYPSYLLTPPPLSPLLSSPHRIPGIGWSYFGADPDWSEKQATQLKIELEASLASFDVKVCTHHLLSLLLLLLLLLQLLLLQPFNRPF